MNEKLSQETGCDNKANNGDLINDPPKVTELLNSNFMNAFTVDNNIPISDLHYWIVEEDSGLAIIHFTPQAVVNILKRLKSLHTITPDGFSCSTIKDLSLKPRRINSSSL